MTEDAWWVKINGEVSGPKKSAELRQLARTGVLHVHSSVSRDGINWVDAGRVRGLFPPAAVPGAGTSPQSEPAKPFQIFISYSTKDKTWADTACAYIEQQRIPCWIAPRDIVPGTEWGKAIVDGIDASQLMLLIFSANANDSPQVRREVERAISKGIPVLPFRIEDVAPAGAMEFALSNTHWLDGFTKPVEDQYAKLVRSIQALQGEGQAKIERRSPQLNAQSRLANWKPWPWMPLAGGAGIFLPLLLIYASWPKTISKSPLTEGQVSSGTQNGAKGSAQNALSTGFVSIFNGNDLTGWSVDKGDNSSWEVRKGTLIANSAGFQERTCILSVRDYSDYILRFDYFVSSQAPEKNSSSIVVRGIADDLIYIPVIFPHTPETSPGAYYSDRAIVEYPTILLVSPASPGPTGGSHFLKSILRPAGDDQQVSTPKPDAAKDQWNRVELTVKGKSCALKLNDGVALEFTMDPIADKQLGPFPGLKRTKGRVGFQITQGSLQLRNITIKDLSENTALIFHKNQDEKSAEPVMPVTSKFSPNDTQGWTTANEDGSKNATKKIEIRTKPYRTWLYADDDNPSKSWGWVAPAAYCGNQSDKFALYFNFTVQPIKVNFGNRNADPICIRIRGSGRSLVVYASDLGKFSPEEWKMISVNLSGSGKWRTDSGGKATDNDLKTVLRDVKEIWIRGEYFTSPSGCGLYNIGFGTYLH